MANKKFEYTENHYLNNIDANDISTFMNSSPMINNDAGASSSLTHFKYEMPPLPRTTYRKRISNSTRNIESSSIGKHKADDCACPICLRLFPAPDIQAHIKGHFFPFECTFCSCAFSQVRELKDHIASSHDPTTSHQMHSEESSPLKPEDTSPQSNLGLLAQIADKTTTEMRLGEDKTGALGDYLKNINQTNFSTQKNVSTPKDPKLKRRDSSLSSLSNDGSREQMPKPYTCPICDVGVGSRASLKTHMTVHAPDREQYECPQCQARVRWKQSMTRHMLVHAGVKPFACTLCSFRSTRKEYLALHAKTHSASRPYMCGGCGLRAKCQSVVKQHIKSKHPLENVQVVEDMSGVTTDAS